MNEVLVTAVAWGVAALLRGHVDGTDCDRLLSSAEPGLEGGMGVAALILGHLSMHYMLYQLQHWWSHLYLKHYLNLVCQLILYLLIEWGWHLSYMGPKR